MACGATLKRPLDFDPLLSPSSQSPKRRRCTPLGLSPPSPTGGRFLAPETSLGEHSQRLSPERMLHNLKQEYTRIRRRRQLESSFGASEGPAAEAQNEVQSPQGSPLSDSGRREQPLFTLRQVGVICEGMLHEREVRIQQQYDQILSAKLAEQYEGFVKFTQDQIMRKYGGRPASYVS
uniref:akirin-2 n=1 Tax=Myxine glutinosa TaxID=7769 RepID=UPI00358FE0E9